MCYHDWACPPSTIVAKTASIVADPKQYKIKSNTLYNNNVYRLYLLWTITWLFSYGYRWWWNLGCQKIAYFAGYFDSHGNAPIQLGAHITWWRRSISILEATGRCHQSGVCTILPPGRHGHQFLEKMSCGVVKPHSEASNKKAENGPSTQVIEVISCV